MSKIFSLIALFLLAAPAWAAPHVYCRDAGNVGDHDYSAQIKGESARVYFRGRPVAKLWLGESVRDSGDYPHVNYYYPGSRYSLKVTTGGIADIATAVVYATDFDSMPIAFLETCE